MGSADVVPGVSGGTVALVLGIYPRVVRSIRSGASVLGALVRGRGRLALSHFRQIEWMFLAPLLIGIITAVVSLAALLENLLEDEPQNMAAAFFGLVVGSIAIAWRLVDQWNARRLIGAAGVAVAAFLALGLRSDEITDPPTAAFLAGGAIAIVAMILPGISGSFILLMLGLYEAVIAAVNDRDVAVVAVFFIGAVIGLALFSTLLDRLLRDHRDTTLALLIGLMIGSLRVLWPWPDGTETGRLAAPDSPAIPILLALAGAVVVVVIGRVSERVDATPATRTDMDSAR